MKNFYLSLILTSITIFNLQANLFDLQMNFNVEDSSGLSSNAAMVFTGTEFW